MKLTKSKVDDLRCPPDKRQAFRWCSEVRGFGVRCTTAGVKSFVVQGRVHGVERRMTVGRYGVFTVDQARDEAVRVLQGMRLGTDPVEEPRRREIEGVTLRTVRDAYLKDRVLKPSSIADIKRHVERSFEKWADRPVARITRAMVKERFRELSDNGLSVENPKPAPVQAQQAFRILRSLLNYARAAYRSDDAPTLPENPVNVLSETKVWGKAKARTERIPNDRLGAVWSMLRARRADVRTVDDHTSTDLVAFMILTGTRKDEARTLRWEHVKLGEDEGSFHLPDTKNGRAVTFPLCKAARELLAARLIMPAAEDRVIKRRNLSRPVREDSPFVFPSWGAKGHITEARGTLAAVSEVAGVPIALHDLRRTFTNVAIKCGVDMYKIELLTNHVPKTITLVHYSETNDLRESCAAEVESIGRWITGQGDAVDAAASGANVVALRA